MTTLTEVVTYESGVYQLETADPVLGGPGGIANTQAQQLANRTAYLKQHVDALETAASGYVTAAALQAELQKLDHKQSVRAASVGNLTLSGTQTIDGVAVVVADRVLVKNQTTASENGIYVVSGSAWTRAVDADTSTDVTTGMIAEVESGTINASQRWQLTTPAPIVLGTTLLTFANISAGYAPLASPAFTGTPTVPTATSGTKNTQAASTDFANNLVKGLAGINVAGNTDVVVTAAEAGAGILKLTGALTGNINLIFPTATGQWIVSNESTGNYSITAKMAAGTGVILPQALATVIYSDSTNVIFAASAGQYAFVPETFTPTAGTTSLSIAGGYTPGLLMIEKNGVWLHLSDYTATDGATVTITASIAADKFTVYAFKSFTVADAVLKSGDTMGGFLSLAADATDPMHAVPKQQLDAALAAVTVVHVRVRQTILSAATSFIAIGTGLACNLLATATPARLSFAAGMDANGEVDYVGSAVADVTAFWSGLTASTTNYLFVDRNTGTGALTGVASTLPYIAQDSSVSISVANNQHTYLTDTGQMYVGNGSVATAVQRTAVGQCVTGASTVTSVTSYAKLRRFTSGQLTIPASGTQIVSNHNVGVSSDHLCVQVGWLCIANDAGWSATVGDFIPLYAMDNGVSAGLSSYTNSLTTVVNGGYTSISPATKGSGVRAGVSSTGNFKAIVSVSGKF